MRNRTAISLILVALAFLTCFSIAPAAGVRRQENLGALKAEIRHYYASGQWSRDVTRQCLIAQAWLHAHRPGRRPPAVVLDIDDTTLNNEPFLAGIDFAQVPEPWIQHFFKAEAPVVAPVRDLIRGAQKKGFHIFFITGRWERFRAATAQNLQRVGITGWERIVMLPDGKNVSSMVPFKSSSRRSIIRDGYDIVLNVGDQKSDLAGGYSRRGLKLPNPMYFTP